MGQKTLFFKKSKRGYNKLLLICFRQVSIERIQTSIIHIHVFFYYFYEFSIKMQHMNHIDSNFATINISPTA